MAHVFGGNLGVIGGGQLARMLIPAAASFGYRVNILSNSAVCPAADLAYSVVVADYGDTEALGKFCQDNDFVTFEFENVNVDILPVLDKIRPKASIVAISQNRIKEKEYIGKLGIDLAPYSVVYSVEDIASKADLFPAILKTSSLGYDGKGQVAINSIDDLEKVEEFSDARVLESKVDFVKEISLIVSRDVNGSIEFFPVAENVHDRGILQTSSVPALISKDVLCRVHEIGKGMAEGLELVGILAIEMFVEPDGNVLVNEIAPRPHNSGHWSMDVCNVSQFEQLVRAVIGLPVVGVYTMAGCEMINLLGDDIYSVSQYCHNRDAKIHLYNKQSVGTRRKMGHVNIIKH